MFRVSSGTPRLLSSNDAVYCVSHKVVSGGYTVQMYKYIGTNEWVAVDEGVF